MMIINCFALIVVISWVNKGGYMTRKKNVTRSDGRIQTRIYIGKDESGKKKYKYVMGYEQFPDVKRLVDIQYNIVLEKHQRGYIYRPRPQNKARYLSVDEIID